MRERPPRTLARRWRPGWPACCAPRRTAARRPPSWATTASPSVRSRGEGADALSRRVARLMNLGEDVAIRPSADVIPLKADSGSRQTVRALRYSLDTYLREGRAGAPANLSDALNQPMQRTLDEVGALGEAIREKRFRLVFQPVVGLKDRRPAPLRDPGPLRRRGESLPDDPHGRGDGADRGARLRHPGARRGRPGGGDRAQAGGERLRPDHRQRGLRRTGLHPAGRAPEDPRTADVRADRERRPRRPGRRPTGTCRRCAPWAARSASTTSAQAPLRSPICSSCGWTC